jgi:hypothetical protein
MPMTEGMRGAFGSMAVMVGRNVASKASGRGTLTPRACC